MLGEVGMIGMLYFLEICVIPGCQGGFFRSLFCMLGILLDLKISIVLLLFR